MRKHIINFLEHLALVIFSAVFIIAPYFRVFTKILFMAGFVCWFLLAVIKYRWKWHRVVFPDNPLNVPILFFLIVCSLTIFLSLDPYHSQKVFVNRFSYYLAAFWTGCAFFSYSRKNFYVLILVILASNFILALGTVRDAVLFKLPRVYTAFGREIPFAMLSLFITYAIPINFAVYIFNNRKSLKVFSLVNLLFLFPSLVWAGARAAWAAVPVSLLAISFFKNKKLVLKVSVTILLSFFIGSLFSGIRQKIQTMPYPSQWNYRTPLFHSALSMFRDRPLIGTGFGMYETLIKTSRYNLPHDYPNSDHRIYLHAHNLYFEILAEMGIIGLFSFLAIFLIYFVYFIKKKKEFADADVSAAQMGIIGMVIAALVFGVSGSIITVGYNEAIIFWFLFGASAGFLRKKPPFLEEK